MLRALPYEYAKNILVGQENEPVRITERIPAKKILISPKGEKIIGSISVDKINHGNYGSSCSIMISLAIEAQDSLKPSISYGNSNFIFCFQKICKIVCLILKQLDSNKQNVMQKTYRIEVYCDSNKVWDTKTIESEKSILSF